MELFLRPRQSEENRMSHVYVVLFVKSVCIRIARHDQYYFYRHPDKYNFPNKTFNKNGDIPYI